MALIDFRNFLNTAKTAINTATPDGENTTLGSKADVAATSGDATPFSSIALLKGIFNKLANTLTVQVSGSIPEGTNEIGSVSMVGNSVEKAFAITPNDSADLAHTTIAIYVGVSGDLKITLSGGDTVILVGLASGVWHPIKTAKVFATGQPGTIASSIVGAY